MHIIEAELALSSVFLPAAICAGIGIVAIGSVAAGVTYVLNKNKCSIIECEIDHTLLREPQIQYNFEGFSSDTINVFQRTSIFMEIDSKGKVVRKN